MIIEIKRKKLVLDYIHNHVHLLVKYKEKHIPLFILRIYSLYSKKLTRNIDI